MNYEFSLYIFQQLINRIIYQYLFNQKPLVVLFIFVSGLVTSLNPCVISMLPISFAYINSMRIRNHRGISFLLGCLLISVSFLFICFIIGYHYYHFFNVLPLLSATIAIYLGLLLLNISPFSIKMQQLDSSDISVFSLDLKSFFVGCFFTINIFSCSAPISFTIFTFVFASSNYILSVFYSLIYLLGYIFLLILLIFFVVYIRIFNIFCFSAIFDVYSLIGGCFMLHLGILKGLEIMF